MVSLEACHAAAAAAVYTMTYPGRLREECAAGTSCSGCSAVTYCGCGYCSQLLLMGASLTAAAAAAQLLGEARLAAVCINKSEEDAHYC